MQTCDLLLRAEYVITQNAARECLENSALAIKDDKIAAIGPAGALLKEWKAAFTKDLGSALLLPGLINAHTHAAMTFLRGMADDLPLLEWLKNSVFPVEANLTHEITKLGSLLGHAEMLATGTTACVDMYIFEDAVFEAAGISGIRCMGGEAVFNFPSAACSSYEQALEQTRELAQKYAGNERLRVAVNPHSVYTTSPRILGACRDLALDLNCPLHIHLAETEEESKLCLEQHKLRPIAYCESLGLFEAPLIAAHLVDIQPTEAALLAKKKVKGVHNPSSNMKLASGAAPLSTMLSHGLAVALGTDGPASNNRLNMFTEMGRTALMHKLNEKKPTVMPAATVLDLATLGGAGAFGDNALGSLEVGKKADIIALDLKFPHMQPFHSPVSQVVYAATGMECKMTMIGGEVVYENGHFSRFDYDALLSEVRQLKEFAVKNRKF